MSAIISASGTYRYRLDREWEPDDGLVVWIMLNPSTADAEQDDPTIRRCLGFSREWGYGALRVVNLYAFRTSSPSTLRAAERNGTDVVGMLNDVHLCTAMKDTSICIAAWGANGLRRQERTIQLARDVGVALHCLAFTAKGCPRHPLYLPADSHPVYFGGADR